MTRRIDWQCPRCGWHTRTLAGTKEVKHRCRPASRTVVNLQQIDPQPREEQQQQEAQGATPT